MTTGDHPRPRRLPLAAFVLWSASVAGAFAQQSDIPPYLNHGADPMQQAFGRAVLGFAIDRNCGFLPDPVRAAYEQDLDRAKIVFENYLVAQGIVNDRSGALDYTRQLIFGAIRFAATLACDAQAAALTQSGLQTSADLRALG